MKITHIEMTLTLSDGSTCNASIDTDGNVFRWGGNHQTLCAVVDITEAMQAAAFESGDFGDEDED
jgi:hypothetical protein